MSSLYKNVNFVLLAKTSYVVVCEDDRILQLEGISILLSYM